MKLFTSRYANRNLDTEKYVPVGISTGRPKFNLAFVLEDWLMDLAPSGLFGINDQKQFSMLYMKRLDAAGVDRIRRKLERISEKHGGKDIVVLCFEDLNKDWCHRRIFADWWTLRTGEPVPELGQEEVKPAKTEETTIDQLSFFP